MIQSGFSLRLLEDWFYQRDLCWDEMNGKQD